MEQDENEMHRKINTFVLRAGRMSNGLKLAYENLKNAWCIPFEKKSVNFADIFGNTNPVVVEIGFGMGGATSLIAEQNPNVNYFALEVHQAGIAKLLSLIQQKKLQNIRIVEHDAMEVLEFMLLDDSVSGFHVFFPDPWPKKKHCKRRLMQKPRTNLIAQKLMSGGYIYFTTDWQPYAEFALEELNTTNGLKNKYENFAPHQEWRPETKFERKGLDAEREIYELFFVKE